MKSSKEMRLRTKNRRVRNKKVFKTIKERKKAIATALAKKVERHG